jgi:hypothetical protein
MTDDLDYLREKVRLLERIAELERQTAKPPTYVPVPYYPTSPYIGDPIPVYPTYPTWPQVWYTTTISTGGQG